MIKNIHEITIGDFDLMEQTGKVSHLRKAWNVLPVFLFIKQIAKVINEISTLLQGNNINDDEMIIYILRSLLKIQRLESSYAIVVNQLYTNIPINQLARDINLKKKLKESKDNILNIALKEIEILTGLTIGNNVEKDLREIQSEIIRLKDKYNENFKPKTENEESKKRISLLEFAGAYIMYAGGSFVGLTGMTIPELVALKKQAEDKFKKEQQQLNDLKNGRN